MKLICKACGYVYIKDWLDPSLNKGESFPKIQQQFFYEGSNFTPIKIDLYICPECGTVIAHWRE